MIPKWLNDYSTPWDKADGSRGRNLPMIRPPKGIGCPVENRPKNSTYSKKHNLSKLLARYVAAGEGGGIGTFSIRPNVYSPSNRLRLSIRIAIEADDLSSPDPVFVTAASWVVRNLSRNPETGREVALQAAYPSSGTAALPDGFEADTASELFRLDISLADTAFSITYLPVGTRASVWLFSSWEPNVEIPRDELNRLYDACSITWGQPILIQNNAT